MRSRVTPPLAFGVVAGVALSLVSATASASPEDVFGYGARSAAMGGTGSASAEGYEAAYANPALLSTARARTLTLGLQGATFALFAEADGTASPGRISYAPMRGTLIGAALPVPLGGRYAGRIAIGFAFYAPTNVVVRGRILYPERPQFPLLPDRTQSVALRLGLGADVGYGVRVGVGFAALAEILGTAVIATDVSGRVGSRVEDQLVATYAPTVGATYERGSERGRVHTRAGVVFRGALEARFAVVIDATRLSSLRLPLFRIAGLAQYDPAQIALEVAHTRGPWTVALGATYKRWSAYPGPLEATVVCPDDNPECGALRPTAIAFDDTIALRVGGERVLDLARALAFRLRAGLLYEPSPLPTELPASQAWDDARAGVAPVATRYYDAARLGVAFGWGVELRGALPPIRLDFFTQLHALLPTTITAATETAASRAEVSGHVVAGGVTAGVSF